MKAVDIPMEPTTSGDLGTCPCGNDARWYIPAPSDPRVPEANLCPSCVLHVPEPERAQWRYVAPPPPDPARDPDMGDQVRRGFDGMEFDDGQAFGDE